MGNGRSGSASRAGALAAFCVVATLSFAACGQAPARSRSPLPPNVMSAARACRLVVKRAPHGFFSHVERVHLVLTNYAKGEPVESRGDQSTGLPPRRLVWVVEVHAKAVHWNHSAPAGAVVRPATDFSVVMDAKTGVQTDIGECDCWPMPLQKAGRVLSLPAGC